MQSLFSCDVVLVAFLSQNSVTYRMFMMSKLTYKSFMSEAIVLQISFIWIFFSSCESHLNFWCCVISRLIRPYLLKNLAPLYDGSCVLVSRVELVYSHCAFFCSH